MNVIRHPILGVFLALMLALTGQSMAVARGMPSATGEMVLCTGTGPITVLTDENGQPVGPAHICPDCAFGFFVVSAALPAFVLHRIARPVPLRPEQVWQGTGSAGPVPQARGPPVLI